jgi:hypothetical protein
VLTAAGACSSPENARLSLISLRVSTAVDIITDMCSQSRQGSVVVLKANLIIVIALPISIVARVKVSPKQKFGLLAVMSMGIFIIGVAIARVIVTDTQGVHPEISWLALWSVVESSVAVLVCCLASFKAMTKVQHDRSGSRIYHAQAAVGSSQNGAIVLSPIKVSRSVAVRESWDCDQSSQVEILGATADTGIRKLNFTPKL